MEAGLISPRLMRIQNWPATFCARRGTRAGFRKRSDGLFSTSMISWPRRCMRVLLADQTRARNGSCTRSALPGVVPAKSDLGVHLYDQVIGSSCDGLQATVVRT